MQGWLERRWYSSEPPPLLLQPLARLYGAISERRRTRQSAAAVHLDAPLIVVGNISVGGTGKTPMVIWLVEQLRGLGRRPGVISRGYGGRAPQYPFRVRPDTDPMQAGDEPVLIAWRTGAPVMVDPDRVRAAQALLASGEVDVLVSDDGLQHYRLRRDFEFCVVDGRRGLGNGALLPAGPLRESPARLREIDCLIVNGGGFEYAGVPVAEMQLRAAMAQPLGAGEPRTLESFEGTQVHGVAGIGNPSRFFDLLRGAGMCVIEHPLPDHHAYAPADIQFGDVHPVLMTEKDAVKCRAFAGPQHWSVPVSAQFKPAEQARMQQSLARLFS